MDETATPPQQWRELPEHVRKFLTSLEPDDIELVKSGMGFAKWFRTTGRVTKVLVMGGLAIFGGFVALVQAWDYFVGRFFTAKIGG